VYSHKPSKQHPADDDTIIAKKKRLCYKNKLLTNEYGTVFYGTLLSFQAVVIYAIHNL
jgi:hypothetical protein